MNSCVNLSHALMNLFKKIEPSASIRVIKTDAVYPEVVTISKKQTVLKYGMIGFVLGLLLSSVSILIWTLGRKK